MTIATIPQGERPYRKVHGSQIVAGELVEQDEADILTCNLETFDDYMRRIYSDWPQFLQWLDGRYWDAGGVLPGNWWTV